MRIAKAFLSFVVVTQMHGFLYADELSELLGAPEQVKHSNASNQLNQSFVIKQIIGSTTAEQNIFINFMASEKYDKALYAWWDAFEKTNFAKSENGHALYGYLLLKNGLPHIGLEQLLLAEKPELIHVALVQWWRAELPSTHPMWTHVVTKTNMAWESVFGLNVIARDYAIWEQVVNLGLQDDYKSAAPKLNQLIQSSAKAVSEDLLNITAARFLFQNGYLEPAIRYYQKIPKKSDYYFEAQEEAAWSYLRLGEAQNALAITRSLIQPEFSAEVGPETIYLHALLNLKVCDYPEVIKNLSYFKSQYRAKAEELLKITKEAESDAALKFASLAKVKSARFQDMGELMKRLPRFITRDHKLEQALRAWNDLEREAKIAGDIYAASLTGGTNQVGFQARYEYFKMSVESRADVARAASFNRIQMLATEELHEIGDILKKLHIVEAEVIQQVSLSGRVIGATKNKKINVYKGRVASSKDQMVFPFDGEVWFDELTNYSVDVKKGCQAASL